ncbi:Nif3-like dinuclear metal center hexameric protein [Roseisolibacter agri]|uniref:Nif3-like dinuclear metal center hexameric protein n=1 Tax=Roseisolibacter agri TaxID=2014610 RepID=UPI0024E138ED|nr:Nif3-like dinuclear metal center hexameric protein [Roseisolibacter agri]
MHPDLTTLAASLDAILAPADDPVLVLRERAAPVARLGLALEPWPGLRAWVDAAALDAVLLHRHWALSLDRWPAAVGVLASHDAFDRRYGFGRTPELADALSLTLGDARDSLGDRDGHPLGSVGTVRAGGGVDVDTLRAALVRTFGGVEAELAPSRAIAPTARVAMARAMTPALVERAAALGAGAYVTGQLRAPAREAALRAELHVFAVGHRRAEEWALARLAEAVRGVWPALRTMIAENGGAENGTTEDGTA